MAESIITKFAVLCILTITASTIAMVNGPCGLGHYLDEKTQVCMVCGPGTFMDKPDHQGDSCWLCKSDPLPGSRQEVKRPCTSTSDTELGCVPYAYQLRKSPYGLVCMSCTKCMNGEEETGPCTEYRNRKCQPIGSGNNCSSLIKKDVSKEKSNEDHNINSTDIQEGSQNSDDSCIGWIAVLLVMLILQWPLLRLIGFVLAKYYPDKHNNYSCFITGTSPQIQLGVNPTPHISDNNQTAGSSDTDPPFAEETQTMFPSNANTPGNRSTDTDPPFAEETQTMFPSNANTPGNRSTDTDPPFAEETQTMFPSNANTPGNRSTDTDPPFAEETQTMFPSNANTRGNRRSTTVVDVRNCYNCTPSDLLG